MELSCRQLRQKGKEARNRHLAPMVLMSLLYMAIAGIASSLAYTVDENTLLTTTTQYSIYVDIFNVLITPILAYGLIFASVNCVRGLDVSFGNLFAGFSNYFKIIATSLLMGLYILLWSLLFVIPGIIASYRYSLAYYVLRDNPDLSPNQAISVSKELMDGNKGKLFVLQLSFLGWILLSTLTLGILLLWVVPHITCTTAVFYQEICDQHNRSQRQSNQSASSPFDS